MIKGHQQQLETTSESHGSVSLELTLVLPVLLFMFFGVGTLGRIIGQLSWMSQVAYQTTLAAGEADDAERGAILEARWTRILEGYEARSGGSRPVEGESRAVTIVTDPAERSVSVEISGGVLSLLGGLTLLPVQTTIVGPLMAPDATAAGSLSAPMNPPTGSLWNCIGAQGTGGTEMCLSNCLSLGLCQCALPSTEQTVPC